MSFISLEVKDTETGLEWLVELRRRITVVRGDSGIGKSEFVRMIVNPPMGVEVNTALPCVTADESNWEAVLDGSRESVIIIDDAEIVSTSRFAKKVKETESNMNYFLIIGREQIGEQEVYGDNFYRLSYSVKSILRFAVSSDGKKHYTEQFYNLRGISAEEMEITDVLIEDAASGAKFFNALTCNHAFSAKNGKSSITEDAVNIMQGRSDGLLVLPDLAAFGCHMDKFYYKVMRRYKNVYIDAEYECFEYLLLNTNFFKSNKVVETALADYSKANQYISWERFYESVLESVTNQTEIKYIHGNVKFRECWFRACQDFESNNCNLYIQQKCSYYMADDDKCRALLEGTMFKKYLVLRDRITKN